MSEVTERWVEFRQLSCALSAANEEFARLQLIVDAAPHLVPRCDHAGMTLNEKGGVLTRVSSDDVVRRANELQYELGEGPCLNMMRDQDTLVVPDLAVDQRWPRWSVTVHEELGVSSMMSLLVFTDSESYGALSLYNSRGRPFDADDVAIAQGLAGHMAATISNGREVDHLGSAIVNRLVIGQAQGILMERLAIDADQAFDYLRRASSHTNRKLVSVAHDIVQTLQLPDLW